MQAFSYLTIANIIDAAKAESIGSTTSALTALQDTQLIERTEQICSGFVNSAHTRHSKGGWSWMQKTANFKTVNDTTLDGAVAAAALTIDLTSASDWDSTGRSAIETTNGAIDFVDHESKSSNEITVSTTTGAESVGIAHADNEKVVKLYALPSDYAKTRALYINSTEYFYERSDLFPRFRHFTTYGSYILLPKSIGAQDVTHYYEKKAATLTSTTDTTDIPTEFQRYPIEMLKAHILTIRRQRNDVPVALQLAEEALGYALDYDIQAVSQGPNTGIQTDY